MRNVIRRETAAGDYPLEAVQTMARIAVRTEETLVNQDSLRIEII